MTSGDLSAVLITENMAKKYFPERRTPSETIDLYAGDPSP